ncbi:RluA family pseudouridine synthase [Algoriphagus formosus]|uniref:RluA family pseudouridine synthase n=1 Tax=Algoriphagus formosus TaxID=2007308 RepID=UPI003F6E63A9
MNQQPEEEFEDEEVAALYEHYHIKVDKGQSPIRIDKFLTEKVAFATRNKVQQAIDNSFVLVNGQSTKANYKIKPLDEIRVMFPQEPRDTEVIPENIPLDIVYEDTDLLVVNKPAGMVVHPAHGNWTGTLVNGLVYHFQQLPEMKGNVGRPGLVHRIDKDTSGLLVIAKKEEAMTHLAAQFYHHTIERKYIALVWGEMEEKSGTITGHVGRSAKDRKIMDVYPDGDQGKHAVTHWEVINNLRYVSLISCQLETGRTHQIRAHMKYLGHPLFSDAMYGGDKIRKGTQFSKYKSFVENCFQIMPRQALHAKSLGFKHPRTGENMYFEAPLPEDFSAVLAKWEHYVQYE